ncbi:Superinfection exclusion protein B [Flavobacterium swingsii]|uniref:Superinfection exclusion protein B n=1 Tax=Flavobacterium swingsii TaxID=498292 RepID=A0A1I0Z048_9FLAO|nr:super-infection exclusion protein B [Flavobacterium swingsii]SFB19005.1 Superinfection exclusion protein B [Flavobacterium swingsii]
MGIEEIFKGIFDIKKIPTKIFFVMFIVGTFIFYAPNNLVSIQFKNGSDLKIYVYIIYLVCSGIFVVNCVTGIFNYIKDLFLSRQIKKEYKNLLNNLDDYERAVLREFYLYNKNTLDFPYEDNIIKGLVDKKILFFASQFGGSIMLSGRNSTFKINSYLKEIIDIKKDLGLTDNPNKREADYILKNRPHWTENDLQYI